MSRAVTGDAAKWIAGVYTVWGHDEAGTRTEGGEAMNGLRTLYAGRAMTMWETREEAEASWRASSFADLWERTAFPFWRASAVEAVECPPDVLIQDVLKRDL